MEKGNGVLNVFEFGDNLQPAAGFLPLVPGSGAFIEYII